MNPAGTWATCVGRIRDGGGLTMGCRAPNSLRHRVLTTRRQDQGAADSGGRSRYCRALRSPWFCALVLPTLAWRFAGSVTPITSGTTGAAVLVPIAACALLDVVSRWIQPSGAGRTRGGPRSAAVWPRGRSRACPPCPGNTASFLPCGSCRLAESPRWRQPRALQRRATQGTSVERHDAARAARAPSATRLHR